MSIAKTKTKIFNNGYEIFAIRDKAIKASLLDLWEEDESEENCPTPDNTGTMTIPIHLPLSQNKSWTCDGYNNIKAHVESGLKNNAVKKIVLDIDSPGGDVLGVSFLAEFIFLSRTIKPIVAYVNSMAASAAYWIASACSKIILASETTLVGSIGVVAIHVDQSQYNSDMGIKITEIIAGKYKRAGSPNTPLDKNGLTVLQSQVDTFYNLFLSSVAKYRNKDIEDVLDMADGKEFIGSQAIAIGLADEIQTKITLLKGQTMDELEKLRQENEMLRKELEQLKKQNENTPINNPDPNKEPQQEALDEEKKCEEDEEEKLNPVAMAVKAERARILTIEQLAINNDVAPIIAQGKQDGWSAEKTAFEAMKKMAKIGGQKNKGIRDTLAKETNILRVAGDIDKVTEEAEKEKRQKLANIMAGKESPFLK